jgi:hypothetical protein
MRVPGNEHRNKPLSRSGLAGHDHDLQHLEFEGHPTTPLSLWRWRGLYDLKVDPSQRRPYAQKVYGFSHLSVTDKQMTLRHLDSNGRTCMRSRKRRTESLKF